jgi:hypothetical protein
MLLEQGFETSYNPRMSWDRDREYADRRRARRGKSSMEKILSGAAIAVAFSVFWYLNPQHMWPIFAILFAGVFPAVRGVQGLIAERADTPKPKKLGAKERVVENERTVLRIARSRAGRITPSLVVLDSDMNLDEAETTLADLTKKGHASMRISDDGRIDYEFTEFLPE